MQSRDIATKVTTLFLLGGSLYFMAAHHANVWLLALVALTMVIIAAKMVAQFL